MYCAIPPARGREYRELRFTFTEEDLQLWEPDSTQSNWLLLSGNHSRGLLYVGAHKTYRHIGVQRTELSADGSTNALLEQLVAFVCRDRPALLQGRTPQDFLFLHKDVSITTNTIRASYVTHLLSGDDGVPEHVLVQAARAMRHSRVRRGPFCDTGFICTRNRGGTIHVVPEGLQKKNKLPPSVGDIVALAEDASTREHPVILLGKVLRIYPDSREVLLAHLKQMEKSRKSRADYKITAGRDAWVEGFDSLVFPIDIAYDTARGVYSLRTPVRDIHDHVFDGDPVVEAGGDFHRRRLLNTSAHAPPPPPSRGKKRMTPPREALTITHHYHHQPHLVPPTITCDNTTITVQGQHCHPVRGILIFLVWHDHGDAPWRPASPPPRPTSWSTKAAPLILTVCSAYSKPGGGPWTYRKRCQKRWCRPPPLLTIPNAVRVMAWRKLGQILGACGGEVTVTIWPMLPIVERPPLQGIVDECAAGGCVACGRFKDNGTPTRADPRSSHSGCCSRSSPTSPCLPSRHARRWPRQVQPSSPLLTSGLFLPFLPEESHPLPINTCPTLPINTCPTLPINTCPTPSPSTPVPPSPSTPVPPSPSTPLPSLVLRHELGAGHLPIVAVQYIDGDGGRASRGVFPRPPRHSKEIRSVLPEDRVAWPDSGAFSASWVLGTCACQEVNDQCDSVVVVPHGVDGSGKRLVVEIFRIARHGRVNPMVSTGVDRIAAGLSYPVEGAPTQYHDAYQRAKRERCGLHAYGILDDDRVLPKALKGLLTGKGTRVVVENNSLKEAGRDYTIPAGRRLCLYSDEVVGEEEEVTNTDYCLDRVEGGRRITWNPLNPDGANLGRYVNQGPVGPESFSPKEAEAVFGQHCNVAYRHVKEPAPGGGRGHKDTLVVTMGKATTSSSTHAIELLGNYGIGYWIPYVLSHHQEWGLGNTLGYDPIAGLPARPVKRILKFEFVEMADMLPDAWQEESQSGTDGNPMVRRLVRRAPLTEITLWLEGFAQLASVLTTTHPTKSAELWAYQSAIIRAARNFEGTAWVAYDRHRALTGIRRQRTSAGTLTTGNAATIGASIGTFAASASGPIHGSTTYPYTRDLMRLQSCPSLPPSHVELFEGGRTPLILAAWKAALARHPDRDFAAYICSGIQFGFRIGFVRSCSLKSASANMFSSFQHPDIIQEYISKELDLGRMLGPLDPTCYTTVHINRFGVVPKGHNIGKWCLITDLSYPPRHSVNDGIDPELCSLHYTSVDDMATVAAELGQGALMTKVDIEAAYRLVPVHIHDRPLLGMEWKGQIFADPMLPFGLRSAPKIFNAIADALEWYLKSQGSPTRCMRALSVMRQACVELGIPLAEHKTEGPATRITFLGIMIDTTAGQLSLPPERSSRGVQSLLADWGDRKSCSKKELKSLIGTLNHACKVIRPGRSFLRRMIDLVPALKGSQVKIPTQLLEILVDTSGEWTSQTWTRRFRDTFAMALAPSTHRSYDCALRRFNSFCVQYNVSDPFPVTEKLLCYFSTKLANDGLAPQTIKVYLSAIRSTQLSLGLPLPHEESSLPVLKRVLDGIRRTRASECRTPRIRLPITVGVLRQIHTALGADISEPDGLAFWAIATSAFFGFFRLGELLMGSETEYSPANHLSWGDVALDTKVAANMVKIHLKSPNVINVARELMSSWAVQGVYCVLWLP
eukprot:Em0703g1a